MKGCLTFIIIAMAAIYMISQNAMEKEDHAKYQEKYVYKKQHDNKKIKSKPKAVQEAYCRVNKNRIFIYSLQRRPKSEREMHDIIKEVSPVNTDGRMTAAYFFEPGTRSPKSGFSDCSGMLEANEILYESPYIDPWTFAYMVSFNGETTFANCLKKQGDDLCKK